MLGDKVRRTRTLRDQILLCEPSQSGDFPVALQPQKKIFFAFFGGVFHRYEIGAFVRGIAKRLFGGFSAGAPEIGLSSLYFDGIRCFLRDFWGGHKFLPFGCC